MREQSWSRTRKMLSKIFNNGMKQVMLSWTVFIYLGIYTFFVSAWRIFAKINKFMLIYTLFQKFFWTINLRAGPRKIAERNFQPLSWIFHVTHFLKKSCVIFLRCYILYYLYFEKKNRVTQKAKLKKAKLHKNHFTINEKLVRTIKIPKIYDK